MVDVTPQMSPGEYTKSWVAAIHERMDKRAAGDPDWWKVGPLGAKATKEAIRRSITATRARPKPILP